MLKSKFKKFFYKNITKYRNIKLSIFGKDFYNPSIWYFNKYTVSKAMSIGLFFAWMPIPFQMFLAASFAILFRANLPVSVSMVWLTNPITMPILFLFAYKFGAIFFVVDIHDNIMFELSMNWFLNKFMHIWKPFLLGCFLCAIISSILGNLFVRIIWRLFVIKYLCDKRKKNKKKIKKILR